jgi:hypothetical protein
VIAHTPLKHICSTFYRYTKPWNTTIGIGILVGLMTIWMLSIPGMVAGVLYYYFKKKWTLGYIDIGGFTHAITFEASVIPTATLICTCFVTQRITDP